MIVAQLTHYLHRYLYLKSFKKNEKSVKKSIKVFVSEEQDGEKKLLLSENNHTMKCNLWHAI